MKRFLWIPKESGTQWKWIIGELIFSTNNSAGWGEDFVVVVAGVAHDDRLHYYIRSYLLRSLYKKIEFQK